MLRHYSIVQKYLDCVEQFGDHSRDSPEEERPTATLHLAPIPLDFHERPPLLSYILHDPGRIHILHSGQEHSVDSADLFQLAQVLLYRSGISQEVFVGCKLGRVDEDRYDRLVVRLLRVTDEAEMSRV